MTMISVPCREAGCQATAPIDKSSWDDLVEVVNARCAQGHVFSAMKNECPRCGSAMAPSERRPVPPSPLPQFHRSRCTREGCGYQGPADES